MHRRTFLEIAAAFTSIEVNPSDTVAAMEGRDATRFGGDLASLARALPEADTLATQSDYAFSLTRLADRGVAIERDALAGATAYGTVFAGPIATDVAFGVPDTEALTDELHATEYEVVDRRGGWTVLGRQLRTRYRLVGVHDSTAVLGVGPAQTAVRDDVEAAMDAVEQPADAETERSNRRALVDLLGTGSHVSVNMTPDPRKIADQAVATGIRYDVRGDTTAVRAVTLFESTRYAHSADGNRRMEAIRGLGETTADPTTERRGRGLLQEATVPTVSLKSGRT